MNTAQLRSAAWDAEKSHNYVMANELYCAAAEKYPAHSASSELAKLDLSKLIERAKTCAELAKLQNK